MKISVTASEFWPSMAVKDMSMMFFAWLPVAIMEEIGFNF